MPRMPENDKAHHKALKASITHKEEVTCAAQETNAVSHHEEDFMKAHMHCLIVLGRRYVRYFSQQTAADVSVAQFHFLRCGNEYTNKCFQQAESEHSIRHLEKCRGDLGPVQAEALRGAEQLGVSAAHAQIQPQRLHGARQPICGRRAHSAKPLCRHLLERLCLQRCQPLPLLPYARAQNCD